ncbi:MAG: DUF4236 domain-containing protein [Candidatus Sericytochromatia bacterium]|nr:DUF4236 domain-containing protein [Candidatus Tanganyikabacteria bacterium]
MMPLGDLVGWRFRRTVRLLPGISLNLGMGRPSVSFGKRGARVTVDEEGVRATTGLPGTGLSYTSRASWRSGQRKGGGGVRVLLILLALAVVGWLGGGR